MYELQVVHPWNPQDWIDGIRRAVDLSSGGHGEDDQLGLGDHDAHVEEEIHDYVHVCGEVCEVVLEDDGLEMNEPCVLYYLMIFLAQCKNVL